MAAAGPTHWDSFRRHPRAMSCGRRTGPWPATTITAGRKTLIWWRRRGSTSTAFPRSWARVMPEGRGAVNADGLDFYDRLVDGMLARGLKPAADAVSLGTALGAGRSGRLAQPRHRRMVRRFHRNSHGPDRRPGLVGRADQRAVVRGLAEPFPRAPCAGFARYPGHGTGDASRAAGPWNGASRPCADWG